LKAAEKLNTVGVVKFFEEAECRQKMANAQDQKLRYRLLGTLKFQQTLEQTGRQQNKAVNLLVATQRR
jgi:hypothetical protein